MHYEQLEKLISIALVTGDLSEKKKQVLFKKAEDLGIDLDEFEMILEAKLFERQQSINQNNQVSTAPKSGKFGDVKKCPSCGALVQSFHTKCTDCGNEFSGVEATSSVKFFFERLNEIENQRRPNSTFGFINAFGTMMAKGIGIDDKITSQKKTFISNFPISNTKEDIIEFLSIAVPRAKKVGNFFTNSNAEYAVHNEFVPVWKGKCEQVIIKAKFSMKDDKKALEEIMHYAKQLGIK